MSGDIWNDDQSWWHQQDLEMQERDEEERAEKFNKAIAELQESYDE